ncbi:MULTISPECIES: hypothetical protein [Paenibacillus]|uniref:hypothetical protein n=1 Tax=Paenibacillus TaxID=44249 RepID=UPI000B99396D|nr:MULTISPECIES: hypothetical protein [Paenibacillus]MBJ9988838.1 hypothetical protein [Paenibacillus sp. S28]OZB96489.1 hypothetical protein CJP46_11420 [Paenibacillus sp. XY044]PQP91298.1 hypothetical protein CPT76_01880 [Paenibacillus sp. AR247]
MTTVMFFVHILGALSLGFYLVLPFVVGKVAGLSLPAQEGSAAAIRSLNTFAQVGLVIQLLTGGYLMSQGDYSVPWMIIIVILLLALGAISGIMGKPLRLAIKGIQEKRDISVEMGKIRTLSALLAICLLIMTFFMVYNHII